MTKKKQTERKVDHVEHKVEITEDKKNHAISSDQTNDNEKAKAAENNIPADTEATEVVATEEAKAEVSKAEAELLEKLAEMQDKYLRLMAEFENYRKRTLREKIELTKNAGEEIIKGILPVLDDFERALKIIDESSDFNSIKDGISLIYNKFVDFLKQKGVKEIESLNCDFNVDLHDAVSKVQVEDESMKGKIVEVLQKGYYLNDKVMRHSKVVIGE